MLHTTPSTRNYFNGTNQLTNYGMQIPIYGLPNEATMIYPQFLDPTKCPTHLKSKIHQTHTTLLIFYKRLEHTLLKARLY